MMTISRERRYGWVRWLPLVLLVMAVSCQSGEKKKLNKRITFKKKDKIPYGDYVAYENLSYLFPDAEISVNRLSPGNLSTSEGKKLLIAIGTHIAATDEDVNAVINFASAGNHVFLSAEYYEDTLLRALNLRTGRLIDPFEEEDSLRLSVYSPVTGDSLSFVYPGFKRDNWLTKLDTNYATVLGRDMRGRPNLVQYSYKGGGSILLQFAPMAFTNFFLLHKQNMAYYNNVLSYIPRNIKEVLWDDYFRYDKTREFSAWSYILSNRALRWAFWLLLILFGIIYLFDSKRKQRMIPVISGLRNNSLDFVRTIGRLYYQRRDNHNLVQKIAAHFHDHVRTRYNMTGDLSDGGFVGRLAYKTGIKTQFLLELTGELQRLQDSKTVTDEELLALNHTLEEFYKHA